MTRSILRGLSIALVAGVVAFPAAAQAPETFNGCFVPSVGAFYLIKRTGLPTACVATGHIEVTWTGSGAPADGSITAVKLADGSVVSIKLADGAVTSAKIAGAAVGTGQIADGAVVAAKLGADVGAAVLGAGSVKTATIGDGVVTIPKLAFDPATQAELDAAAAAAGTVKSVTGGSGLIGGTITASGTLELAWGGDGVEATAARSDHSHGSANTVIGTNPNHHGYDNVGIGGGALAANVIGNSNVAVGFGSLGASGSNGNVAVGNQALRFNTAAGNTAVGNSAMRQNTSGNGNTAVGQSALFANETANNNTALGSRALIVSTAAQNTAVGSDALYASTSGSNNTAVGNEALLTTTTGGNNTAVGRASLWHNVSGGGNTAVGLGALAEALGSSNIGVGMDAGAGFASGSYNIMIGNGGAISDNATTRIGSVQTKAFMAGIFGVTTGTATGVNVLIDNQGQLGTINSSRRFKQDIQDMGDASGRLRELRPVSFRYKQGLNDGSHPLEYGLIAEEVAEAFPELVVMDSTGQAQTVKYHVLPVLLLNELQRLSRRVDSLEAALKQQGK